MHLPLLHPSLTIPLGSRQLLPFLHVPFRLSAAALNSHFHVMGVTGQGKSKLLANLAAQMILNGRACSVVDPHADLAHDILQILLDNGYFRRSHATQKLLYVDFARRDRYIPFNVLKQPYAVDEVARNLVEACTRAWPALADGVAPQFENLLLAAAVVLIENQLPVTMVTRLLTNRAYREGLLRQVHDGEVIAFFHDRYDQWGKDSPQMIESTLRRIFLLSFSPALRNTIGQSDNALDFRALMDSQVSVIMSLGGLDEQTQRLLGSLVTVGFEVAALSRADMPEKDRAPYQLIMDEFSMFSAQSEEALSRVLSLARKYKLFLILAHQTWSQLSARLQGALQNSMPIYFRLGYDDAVWAAPRLGEADPYHIKHEVKGLKGHELTVESHPAYFHLQEEYEAWTRRIENLWPQQAYVKVNLTVPRLLRPFFKRSKTIKIRTKRVPPPRCSPDEVEAIKDHYAQTIMRPLGQLEGTAPAIPARESPLVDSLPQPSLGVKRIVPLRKGFLAKPLPRQGPEMRATADTHVSHVRRRPWAASA